MYIYIQVVYIFLYKSFSFALLLKMGQSLRYLRLFPHLALGFAKRGFIQTVIGNSASQIVAVYK